MDIEAGATNFVRAALQGFSAGFSFLFHTTSAYIVLLLLGMTFGSIGMLIRIKAERGYVYAASAGAAFLSIWLVRMFIARFGGG